MGRRRLAAAVATVVATVGCLIPSLPSESLPRPAGSHTSAGFERLLNVVGMKACCSKGSRVVFQGMLNVPKETGK